MKKILIYTDESKFQTLLDERKRFARQLNEGVATLKSLPFVDGQEPTLEDLKDPVGWFDSQILAATQPRKIKGMDPDPRQLAITYRVDFDSIIAQINKVPWVVMDMLDFADGLFVVSAKIEEQVREAASTYGTSEQKAAFDQQAEMLVLLNRYCEQFITFPTTVNEIADRLLCKAVRKSKNEHPKIISDHRALMHLMNTGTTNF